MKGNSEIDKDHQRLESYFRSAKFLQSAPGLAQCPQATGVEIAFAGRSNAGKSSAINKLVGNKKLAKISKTPGRTQLINFFSLADGNCLVDLPGYGYAKVSRSKKDQWQQHLMGYLEHRQPLCGLVLLMDVRHPLQQFDEMMLEWAAQYEVSCTILLTKADKLSKNAAKKAFFQVQSRVANMPSTEVMLFSSLNGEGLFEARQALYRQLNSVEQANAGP